MKLKWLSNRAGRVAILVSVFTLGIVIGTSVFGTALADTVNGNSHAPNFPKNASGKTYGSAADASSPDAEPDLIKAQGLDGTIGYVLKSDLDGKRPKNPQEALEQQKNAPESRVIPLYDVDGKTVIGKFRIGKGQVIEKQAK